VTNTDPTTTTGIDRGPAAGIRLDIDGPVARLTLDRPERHNALDASDVALFLECLEAIESNASVRVLVLASSGSSTFCAGAALDQMESGEMSGAIFDGLTEKLAGLRLPTVGVLDGSVYGGGAEVGLCCDFRVGVEDIRLSVPAARLGVCYPVGGLTRYVDRLGLGTASRILLANEVLESAELERVGYLTHRVARTELERVVEDLVERLASLAPLAVQSMKAILLAIAAGRLDAEAAEKAIARCADSDDMKEGLAAYRERRPPVFEGR